MQVTHSNTLDALRRVQGFLAAQATALGAVIPASLRSRLDGAVTQLAAFQVEQTAAKGEAANQAALRKGFRSQFMRPIARIAKALSTEIQQRTMRERIAAVGFRGAGPVHNTRQAAEPAVLP